MPDFPWFRFYTEALTDRKIQRVCNLTHQPKATVIGVWVTLLSLASESPERGRLLITDDVPITVTEILDECGLDSPVIIEAFIDLGMIYWDEGTLVVNRWESRQYDSDNSTKRVQRHRERRAAREQDRNVSETFHETKRNVSETPSESDTESELIHDDEDETRARDETLATFQNAYQANIGVSMSPVVADEMRHYCDLPVDWLTEAVGIAAANNVRKWSYVRGILDRSRAAGIAPRALGPPGGNGNKKKTGGRQQPVVTKKITSEEARRELEQW